MTPSVKLPNGSDALPYVSRTSHSHHQAQARPLESPPQYLRGPIHFSLVDNCSYLLLSPMSIILISHR